MITATNAPDGLLELAEEFTYSNGPTEIQQDQFDEALNILPPVRWNRMASTESFLMSEFYTGSITDHYVRIADNYYVIRGCAKRFTHDTLVDLIRSGQTIADYLQGVYLTPSIPATKA